MVGRRSCAVSNHEAPSFETRPREAVPQDEDISFVGKISMTTHGTFSFDAPGDAARGAELRRVKALATLVLAGTLALFVIAKALLPVHPSFGFVAAFAEAATIGGLADWYAVVALFKRPLGLPIPHTAIIPANQNRIADNLGHFIEVNFLTGSAVSEKLRTVDFAALVADWLRDRKRSGDLARFVLHHRYSITSSARSRR